MNITRRLTKNIADATAEEISAKLTSDEFLDIVADKVAQRLLAHFSNNAGDLSPLTSAISPLETYNWSKELTVTFPEYVGIPSTPDEEKQEKSHLCSSARAMHERRLDYARKFRERKIISPKNNTIPVRAKVTANNKHLCPSARAMHERTHNYAKQFKERSHVLPKRSTAKDVGGIQASVDEKLNQASETTPHQRGYESLGHMAFQRG